MQARVTYILALAIVLGTTPLWGVGQESGITAKLHPWGQFDPGTWKLVRVVTETLNEQGQVVSTSTTDTKTTLMDIDNEGVTLKIEACMEVAGKRFQSEPQTVKQGFHGELIVPNIKLKKPVDGQVVIENKKVSCKVQQLEVVGPTEKSDTRIYYSTTVSPYVLKRKSVVSDPEGKNVLSETSFEVLALNMPIRMDEATQSGTYVKASHKGAKGTVTTMAVLLPEVPGGVVSQSLKEVGKTGRVVRRSTLELVEFKAHSGGDQIRVFSRKRSGRRAKQTSRYGP